MGFFQKFYKHGWFVRSLNTTFLVLFSKKGGVEDLRDVKPISLVGGLYKLVAKVLANRLKKVVDKMVSSGQNAFVEGRQILDATLIANEAIDSLLKNNESEILCKLDIEKAYDHLNWDFLLQVMQKMGVGEKWIGWIKWCISIATFSILINGTLTGFFHNSLGLRQEGSLSPYLFMIEMEALSCLIKRVEIGGFFRACWVKRRGGEEVQITRLLYVDDTLIFCEATKD